MNRGGVGFVGVGRCAGGELQRGRGADTGSAGGGGHRHGGAVLVERGDDPITAAQPDVDTGQPVAGQAGGLVDQPGHDGAPRKIAAMP